MPGHKYDRTSDDIAVTAVYADFNAIALRYKAEIGYLTHSYKLKQYLCIII